MSAADAGGLATSSVQFPGDRVTVEAFLARPPGAKPSPGVVVIHEWWGLNDHIKDIAVRFAREGFVALAPDLYSRLADPAGGPAGRKVTTDPAEAAKLMERLKSQEALKDLNAAVRYLRDQPFADPLKVAAAGFCMGGTFALMLAAHNSDLKASVPFYGQIPPSETFAYLLCPILYIYGGQDGWITKQDVARLQEGLKEHRKPGEVRIYPDCPHAFFNDTRPDVYHPNEAQDAWQRAVRFLRQHLRA